MNMRCIKCTELIFRSLMPCNLFVTECRTLLKTMAEDIAPLLHRLADVTCTAKQLHAIVSGENL